MPTFTFESTGSSVSVTDPSVDTSATVSALTVTSTGTFQDNVSIAGTLTVSSNQLLFGNGGKLADSNGGFTIEDVGGTGMFLNIATQGSDQDAGIRLMEDGLIKWNIGNDGNDGDKLKFTTNGSGNLSSNSQLTLDRSGNCSIYGNLAVVGGTIQSSAAACIELNANDVLVKDDLWLDTDGSIIKFGVDSDTYITHLHNNGMSIAGTTSATNAAQDIMGILHTTSGTPANNIGVGMSFAQETSVDHYETGMRLIAQATDVTGGSEDFDFTVNLMSGGSPTAEKMRLTSTGNLSIAGDLTVTGGDIDLSGEISTITLKDNISNALIIGSDGATTTLTMHTNDTAEHIQINTIRTSSGGLGQSPITASLDIASTLTLTGNLNDVNSGGISFDPVISGGHTVSRYNYLKFENPFLGLSAVLTDACIMQFDANAGSHKAIDSGSAHPDIDTTDAWIKININGTVHYIPAYTDKS